MTAMRSLISSSSVPPVDVPGWRELAWSAYCVPNL